MKPAPFAYLAPTSTEEVVSHLADHGESAKILAGGQSLMPLLNMRLARPAVVIDINRVGELDYVKDSGDGGLAIGAIARQRRLEQLPLVRERFPVLAEAARHIGHFQIRNRATIVGSVAHADPAAELPAAMAALDARMVARGPHGEREIPARDFFVTYLTTALAEDELLAEIQLDAPPSGAGWSVREFSRRHGDFALVGAVALTFPGQDGRLAGSRIALFGAGATPVRASRAETLLTGEAPSAGLFREAAEVAATEIDPETDLHASAQYRRALARVVVEQALAEATGQMHRRNTHA